MSQVIQVSKHSVAGNSMEKRPIDRHVPRQKSVETYPSIVVAEGKHDVAITLAIESRLLSRVWSLTRTEGAL